METQRYVSDNVGPAQTHYDLLLSELQGTRTRVLKGRGLIKESGLWGVGHNFLRMQCSIARVRGE